eukprot:scaffold187424_cov36-Prasinocladus_malaysianus.AAC.1
MVVMKEQNHSMPSSMFLVSVPAVTPPYGEHPRTGNRTYEHALMPTFRGVRPRQDPSVMLAVLSHWTMSSGVSRSVRWVTNDVTLRYNTAAPT